MKIGKENKVTKSHNICLFIKTRWGLHIYIKFINGLNIMGVAFELEFEYREFC